MRKIIAAALTTIPMLASAALIDRGGGLIYDTALNVTWLQDANHGAGSPFDDGFSSTDGRMTSAKAEAWVSSLSYYDPVRNVTYSDWRLPKLILKGTGFTFTNDGSTDYSLNASGSESELGHMFYTSLGNVGIRSPAGQDTGCGSGIVCLQNVGPFQNLQGWTYWFSTPVNETQDADDRWIFEMYTGLQAPFFEFRDVYAWAVRDGDVAAVVPEPGSLALLGLGFTALLSTRWRTQQPERRFKWQPKQANAMSES